MTSAPSRFSWLSAAWLTVIAFAVVATAVAVGALALREREAVAAPVDTDIVARVEVTPRPTATAAAAGGPAHAPQAPTIGLRPSEVGQGETSLVSVRQPGAFTGTVSFLGERYPLKRSGDMLWAVVGAGLEAPLGASSATVTTRDDAGRALSTVDAPFTIVAVTRPVDNLDASEAVTSVLTPEAAAREAFLRAYEQFNVFDATPSWDGMLTQPVSGVITTQFGQGRSINGGPVGGFHTGTDIANAEGTPIKAAAPGRVAWAGAMPIRGNTVLVDHGAGVVTSYSHLLTIDVAVGDVVDTTTTIARMGTTGFSTGPHLHWELTIYGVNVDPMTWTTHDFTP